MKRRELERCGCSLKRSSGGHDIFHNPQTKRSAPAPRHVEIRNTLCDLIRRQLSRRSPSFASPVRGQLVITSVVNNPCRATPEPAIAAHRSSTDAWQRLRFTPRLSTIFANQQEIDDSISAEDAAGASPPAWRLDCLRPLSRRIDWATGAGSSRESIA